jgi:hypothetical protein
MARFISATAASDDAEEDTEDVRLVIILPKYF